VLISSSGVDESNSMGTTMTAASTNASAPIRRRRARPRSSLAWASLDKEVRDVERRLESEADSLRENNPMEQKPIVKADGHYACPGRAVLPIPGAAENQALPNS